MEKILFAWEDFGAVAGEVTSFAQGPPVEFEEFSVVYHDDTDVVVALRTTDDSDLMDRRVFVGACPGQDWLNVLGAMAIGEGSPGWTDIPLDGARDSYSIAKAASRVLTCPVRSHGFLDSFSIIENGEHCRRLTRDVRPSPAHRALLEHLDRNPDVLEHITPREFEVLVAHRLAAAGFTRVELRRYSLDDGIDISVVSADRQGVPETIVVEVKTGQDGITLAVLDRLNGVRDRIGAQKALAIASGHVSRTARRSYESRQHYVAAHTYAELVAILNDSTDWSRTSSGLWTKTSGTSHDE